MTIPATDLSPAAAGSRDRLPLVTYVLALGTFLMLTTEFVVAGVLPEISADIGVSIAHAGLMITVFAVGMVVGAPSMALLTIRLSKRLTLILALSVFVIGHVIVALSTDFAMLLIARFVVAVATGAFWAVSAVVASQSAPPSGRARAVGIVNAGGALATVIGVPLGTLVGQLVGWRGTFWSLAAAAAVAAILVARFVPHSTSSSESISVRGQVAGLRSVRLWLALLACALTTGGILAAYTYISPILTDQAGVPSTLVPLVLTGFGVGSFAGSLLGGRFGDKHPHLVTVITPAVTIVLLALIATVSGMPWVTVVVVVLLGLFGLSANGVLIHLVVHYAGKAATLGSAMAVSAFNAGTAIGTGIAGVALESTLGIHGPAIIGTVIVSLTLVPTIALAVLGRRPGITSAHDADVHP